MSKVKLCSYIIVLIECLLNVSRASSGFTNNIIPDVAIHKCYCRNGQVWDKRRCLEQDTFVPMLQIFPWVVKSVNSKEIFVSKLSRVRCKPNQLLVPLKGGTFYIVDKGDLFHIYTGLRYTVDEYCVDHVFDKDKTLRFDGLICVSQPQVPKCCPEKYLIDTKNMDCVYRINATVNPSISKGPNILLNWHSLDGPYTGIPYCGGTQISHQVSLETNIPGHATLHYNTNGIFLQLASKSEFSLPEIFSPADYCVGVEEKDARTVHSAFYCEEPMPLSGLANIRNTNRDKYYQPVYILPIIFIPVRWN